MENSNLEAYLNRYEFTQAFKEKIVLEVLYQGKDIRKTVEEYESTLPGKGVIGVKEVVDFAGKSGAKYFIIEQDLPRVKHHLNVLMKI
jgi:hypothetical protein